MNTKSSLDHGAEVAPPLGDGRLDAPAFHRNKDVILTVLKTEITTRNPKILEVASGSGQHAAYFAEHWPEMTLWPSDINPSHIVSIDGWVRHTGLENVRPARELDVTSPAWLNGEPLDRGVHSFDAILVVNMIHIAHWQAATGLIDGAARRLVPSGALFIYGPFKLNGIHAAASNQAFDESLKSRDPAWGVRDISAVQQAALPHGLELTNIIDMPSNNMTLVLRNNSGNPH